MKQTLAILIVILAGCATKPVQPSFVLQPGTKLIMRGHDDAWEVRKVFRNQTDYWRTGTVVELLDPLVVEKIDAE